MLHCAQKRKRNIAKLKNNTNSIVTMNLLGKDERNSKQKAKEIEYLLDSLYNQMVCIYTLLGILTPLLTS
jgi:hypothetical protein